MAHTEMASDEANASFTALASDTADQPTEEIKRPVLDPFVGSVLVPEVVIYSARELSIE